MAMHGSDKIEQYLLLAKGLKGAALRDLITKATAEPGLFTYGELLALPQVQQLADGEHAAALALLQLFAYGTLSEYRSKTSQYGNLSESQQRKLQILTVATMAVSCRTLLYSDLQRELEIDTIRKLEDLLITDCIYGGVLKGRLDQRSRCFHVEDSLMRDVQPERLPEIVEALKTWLGSAQHALGGIDAQVANVAASTAALEKQRTDLEAAVDAARENLRGTLENKAAAEGAAVAMDEGDMAAMIEGFPEGDGRPRNTKRRR